MKNLNIFIVDDDPDFAEGIGLTLELEGHHVTYAVSGEEAVRKFLDEDIDLTFMDVRMPGMNGVESFRKIRDLKPDAKVVMITAYRVESLLREAIDDGAIGVLQKPITSKALLDKLKEIQTPQVILIADDDPDFAEGVETTLTGEGYVVVRARNGQEALAKVMDNHIDVLLLDIRMPDLSGLEIYGELKRRGQTPPTIIVTGFSVEESDTIQELLALSVRDCLVKPIATNKLLQAIELAI